MTYCPPSGKSNPMILSCGFSNAVYVSKLAGEPRQDIQTDRQGSSITWKKFRTPQFPNYRAAVWGDSQNYTTKTGRGPRS